MCERISLRISIHHLSRDSKSSKSLLEFRSLTDREQTMPQRDFIKPFGLNALRIITLISFDSVYFKKIQVNIKEITKIVFLALTKTVGIFIHNILNYKHLFNIETGFSLLNEFGASNFSNLSAQK
ncbi:hypothetical protein BpHYR1_010523 [Brachionus plicatilis]|uniref:Uncharacterized protein n=1 Tax=Brachionus plicatilis TaxID=10195 RepID=A0A3M7PPM9_BRAPC|nr:hypothetical protein BpHYR1_010523 [Brachionus plicatilis]